MAREVLSRTAYLDRWQELHGGYDPRSSRLVGPWLTIVQAVARPLARLGVAPDVVTLSGALVSALVVWVVSLQGRWLVLAAVIVGLSGLLDSVDGAVAVLQQRTSAFGAVLDSVVDRVSDVLYLVAFWVAGAPLGVCVGAGVVVMVQEYARVPPRWAWTTSAWSPWGSGPRVSSSSRCSCSRQASTPARRTCG